MSASTLAPHGHDRRVDHTRRQAITRLRLAEAAAITQTDRCVGAELAAAIDAVVNLLRTGIVCDLRPDDGHGAYAAEDAP